MKLLRQLVAVVGPDRRRPLVWLTAVAAFHGVLQGASAVVVLPLARSLADGDEASAAVWLAVLAAVATAAALVGYRQSLLGFDVAIGAVGRLHARIGEQLMRLPLGWFGGRSGELSQLVVRGALNAGGAAGYLLVPLVTLTAAAATIVTGLLAVDGRVGLAAVAAALLAAGAARGAAAIASSSEQAQYRADVAVTDRILEFARCQGAIRAAGVAGQAPARRAIDDHGATTRAGLLRSVVALGLNGLATQAAFSLVLVVLAWRVRTGAVVGAELVALFGLVAAFVGPLDEIGAYRGGVRHAATELARLEAFFSEPSLPEPEPERARRAADGTVSFRRVGFAYGTGEHSRPVLTDVSFDIPAGSMVALVGPSGAGKTTVARLLARFYDVTSGAVLVGGVDVREQRSGELVGQLAEVFQDAYLFDGTLRDNVAVGDADALPERLTEVAARSGVAELVARLPDGWDTDVGERGARLSGGERQRVAIARALLKPASIVILDEATAALDPLNERIVTAAVAELRSRGRTTVVIAHRLSTIVAADQILVLDGGRLVESGTHEQLLAADGLYRRFWEERRRAEGWRIAPDAAHVQADDPRQRPVTRHDIAGDLQPRDLPSAHRTTPMRGTP